MRLLKILVLTFFTASITNVNVCGNILFQKNTTGSGNKHFIISNVTNDAVVPLYSRQDQQGKKTIGYNSQHKISQALPAKKNFLYCGGRELFFAAAGKINDYSLISLHCLISI